jgi:hypothetical protein
VYPTAARASGASASAGRPACRERGSHVILRPRNARRVAQGAGEREFTPRVSERTVGGGPVGRARRRGRRTHGRLRASPARAGVAREAREHRADVAQHERLGRRVASRPHDAERPSVQDERLGQAPQPLVHVRGVAGDLGDRDAVVRGGEGGGVVRERRVQVSAAHGRIAAEREAARQHAHVVDGAREVRGAVGVGVGVGEVAGKHGGHRAAEERAGLTAPVPERAGEGECLAARAPGFCHVAAAKRLHVAQEQPDARRVRRSGGRRAPEGFSRRSGLREDMGGAS